MRVKCAYCGKEFEQKPGAPPQKYCSERCARRARYEKGIGKEYVCQYCGKVFHPKTKDRTTYCSRECAYAHRKAKAAEREAMLRPIVVAREKLADLERRLSRFQPIKCIECGRIFLRGDTASNVRICSDECRVKHARRLSLVLDKKKRQRQYRRICEECGREFYTPYGDKRRRFCSRECARKAWARENPEKAAMMQRNENQRRRARKNRATVETIDAQAVFERDGWVCGICGRKVNRKLKYPHPMSATLDHIIPLAAGGSHTWDNVQCAHFICNSRKGAVGPGQLLLSVFASPYDQGASQS